MSLWMLLLLLAGFVLLIGGAELLVRGAARLAADLGISPLVVGLPVVAFGTSSPELAVSVLSAHGGQAGIALGNVVGSNICNVLLILGLSALVAPLVVARQVVRLEVPIMIGVSLLLTLFALDGAVGRWEGALLFATVITYTVWTVRRSRRELREEAATEEAPPAGGRAGRVGQLLQILGGLVLLGVGSKWLIDGAVSVATFFGVSDLVIGLTIVPVGTSLPEIATSLIAVIRGERDLAVGNVVGSCVFNIGAVLGITGVILPIPVETAASIRPPPRGSPSPRLATHPRAQSRRTRRPWRDAAARACRSPCAARNPRSTGTGRRRGRTAARPRGRARAAAAAGSAAAPRRPRPAYPRRRARGEGAGSSGCGSSAGAMPGTTPKETRRVERVPGSTPVAAGSTSCVFSPSASTRPFTSTSIDLTVTPATSEARASAWISSMTPRKERARSLGVTRETGTSFTSSSCSPFSI